MATKVLLFIETEATYCAKLFAECANYRFSYFGTHCKENLELFIKNELERAARSESDLNTIVYIILPTIVVVCGILCIVLIGSPNVRAWLIVLMMLGAFLMVVDSNTKARNAEYQEILQKYNSN